MIAKHVPSKGAKLICFEAYAYIHELGESSHADIHQEIEVVYEQKVLFFFGERSALRKDM